MLIGLASLAANHNLKTPTSKQQMLWLCLFFRISQFLAVNFGLFEMWLISGSQKDTQ